MQENSQNPKFKASSSKQILKMKQYALIWKLEFCILNFLLFLAIYWLFSLRLIEQMVKMARNKGILGVKYGSTKPYNQC